LGCLRRQLGLLGLLGVACVVAAQASAAPAPTLFRLTIVGTAHQEWSVTSAPVDTDGCRRTVTSEGTRTATFRTGTAVIVRVVAGRVLPVDVHGILGKVTLVGANTTDEVCGGTPKSKTADCAPTTRAFTGGTVHAASSRPGIVAFNGIENVRLAAADCPLEPADVRRRPLGPPLNLVRLPKETLIEKKLAGVNLHATRTRRKVYGTPEQGHLVETVDWKIKFVRAQA